MSMTVPAAIEKFDFEPDRLHRYLLRRFPKLRGEMHVRRIGGGQSNPTYFIDIDTQRWVLRKRPVGDLPANAHDVKRECRALRALVASTVPVPKVIVLEEDSQVIGTEFYLMQRVDGRIFFDSTLPDVPVAGRRHYYAALMRGMARLHQIDFNAVGLADIAHPGNFNERQVRRWARSWEQEAEFAMQVTHIVAWLNAHLPTDARRAIVHGDMKLNNVIFHLQQPELIAVLDWELFTIGDPMLDVAHVWASLWQTTPEEYGGILGVDFARLGLPDADEALQAYYEVTNDGRTLGPFYKVLALFRNAGIFHDIGKRAKAGTANSATAERTGKVGEVYLKRAYDLARHAQT